MRLPNEATFNNWSRILDINKSILVSEFLAGRLRAYAGWAVKRDVLNWLYQLAKREDIITYNTFRVVAAELIAIEAEKEGVVKRPIVEPLEPRSKIL